MTGQLSIEGVPHRDPQKSQWFTPPALASRIVQWCADTWPELGPGSRVLEPSAGSGSFVGPALAQGWDVTAYELDERWASHLAVTHPDADVRCEDYMASAAPDERFALCAQNPPFEDGQDGAFLEKALTESDRLAALIRTQALHGGARYRQAWGRDFKLVGLRLLINRPSFGGGSGQFEYCVVQLGRWEVCGHLPIDGTDVDWWWV